MTRKTLRRILFILLGIATVIAVALPFASADAGIAPGGRVTNANANPVAGYLAVGNGPNVNFDHVESYVGAQLNIADLDQSFTNGDGVGLCSADPGDSTGPAIQLGIVKTASNTYQVEFGVGFTGPAAGAQTNNDNCENGNIANNVTSPVATGDIGDSTNNFNYTDTAGGTALIGDLGPSFAFGQVMELDLQYLNGKADISVRNITDDNPGSWFTTGWFSVSGYIGFCQFNEAVAGADADATNLAGPPTQPFIPDAHSTVSSDRHGDTGFFDTAPHGEWTAVPISSWINANNSEASNEVLAPTTMKKGNWGLYEGKPS
jgi:hypothetical protein